MAVLNSLKLLAAQTPSRMSPIQHRRNKLSNRIHEQMQLADSLMNHSQFNPKRRRTVIDSETGSRKQIESGKRVKPWWFTAENGKLVLSVRYGAKVLELAKGKFAVEVGAEKDLLAVLDTIKTAVHSGELDSAIEMASRKRKDKA